METLTPPPKKINSMLLTARIFSSLLALFIGLALIPKLIDDYSATSGSKLWLTDSWEGMVMELTLYVFMLGYIFSWWKKCTGGIIILIASIIQMAPFIIIQGNFGSLIFGLPMVVSGILFLALCREERIYPAR